MYLNNSNFNLQNDYKKESSVVCYLNMHENGHSVKSSIIVSILERECVDYAVVT